MRSIQPWFRGMVLRTCFLDAYPHFAPVLARVDAFADDTCLMAVSRGRGDRVRLHIGAAPFEDRPAEFRGVLQHELHHVIAGHLDDIYSNVPEPVIMQVAKELTANENIIEPLPGNPARYQDYTQFGMRAGQSTWRRYELLIKARDEGRYEPPPTITVRCCSPGEGDELADDLPEHLPEHLRRLLQSGRAAGRDRQDLQVGPAAPQPELDWVTELHRFPRSRVARRQSLRRPSRRDPQCQRIGELPGWSRLPVHPRLLVAIDTSGSMERDLFPRIAGELRAMARRADLVIVECDDQIRREYAFKGELHSVRGRGRTDLRPVFAAEVLSRHRVDGVVYFTDGRGAFPATEPRVKTLWVLSDSRPFDCGWGARVRMGDAEPDAL